MATSAAPEPHRVSPAVAAQPLSVELAAIEARLARGPVCLREVLAALQGRAYELLIVLLVLPFAVPVSVPGMSTPFGLVISGIALPLAFGRLPWLPRRLLDAPLPGGFFAKVLAAARGVVRYLEKLLRPRLKSLTSTRWLAGLHLFGIVVAALLLALPLPIPFTNMIPGWAILLLALGLMERDGLFIVAGHLVLWATLFLLGGAIHKTVDLVLHWLGR